MLIIWFGFGLTPKIIIVVLICFSPLAVNTSAPTRLGALFWLPIVSASFADFTAWAKLRGYTLYGTSAHASQSYTAVTYSQPWVLLLGSEQKGLSPEQSAACQTVVRLPMRGRVTSLNLAVAAGIMLYAMLSQEAS